MTTVALVPWGDTIEDYLDGLGLGVDEMLESLDEGWLFGYVRALRSVGWGTVVVMASTTVQEVTMRTHRPTGCRVALLPAARLGRIVRARAGAADGRRDAGGPARRVATAFATAAAMTSRDLATAFATLGVDVVMVQEYEYPRFDRLVRWGRRRGLPVFGTFQGADSPCAPFEHIVRRRSVHRASGLVAAAAFEAARVRADYGLGAEAVEVIVNPINLSRWPLVDRGDARRRLGVEPAECLFFCHGRIDVQRKGLDVLVDAWHKAAIPDARLVLVGAGDDEQALAALLGDDPGTIDWRPGFTTDRALIRDWLAAADVYVSSSRTEGMAVAPIEAMASATPVVLSAIPGAIQLAPAGEADGACIVPVADVDALAAALAALAIDPDRRERMGRAARRVVEERFTIEAVGAQLRSFIEERSTAR